MAAPNKSTGQPEQRRTLLVYASLAGLLLAFTLASFVRCRESYLSCRDAARNLDRCRELADAIMRLRDRPQAASLPGGSESVEDFASRVEKAAIRAKIPRQAILRVDPQPLRRIGETPYQERVVFLELHAVTVKQVVTLLAALQGESNLFHVRNLRLTAPGGPDNTLPERWHAEITLTNLVFAPINRRSHPQAPTSTSS